MLSTLRDQSALILIVSGEQHTPPADYLGTDWRTIHIVGAIAGQQAISDYEPHVVLIDDRSDSFDGLEFCRQARRLMATYGVIMAITDHNLTRIEAFIAAGCDDVILPPIIPILLQQRLTQLIRGQRIGQPLTESRMWTKLVFEQNRTASLLIDPSSLAIIDANPAACQFYGYTLAEFRTKTLRDITLNSPEQIQRNILTIINNQQEQFQFEHRLANGDIRAVEAHASSVTLDGRLLIYTNIYDITQRLEAENALRRNEAFLRHLYDKMPLMILTLDRDNRIINANQKWERQSGYSLETLLGKPISSLIYPECVPKIEDKIRRLWDGQPIQGLECQLLRRDGQLTDVLLDGDVVQTASGEDVAIFVITDVSLQKHVEYTLREAEAETRSIFASMSDTIFIINEDGRITRIITPENRDTLYLTASDMMGRKLHDIFPTHMADQFLAYIQDALRTHQTIHAEYDQIINGQQYWFNAAISPMNNQRVVWVTRNITSFKFAERAAREHEQRYRLLFEHANDIILLVDMRDGRILDANYQAAKTLGYSREELRRLTIDAIEMPTNTEETRELSAVLNDTQHLIEQTYRRKDGTTFPVETNNRFIQSDDESLMLCFARDISERKAIRQAEQRERVLANVLRDTSAALNQVLELNPVLDAILDNVTRILPSVTASIMLREGDQAVVTRLWGYEQHNHPLEPLQGYRFDIPNTTTFRTMLETGKPFIIADVRQDPTWYDIAEVNWIRSYAGAPILIGDEVIGFISLDHDQPNAFSAEDAKTLQAFANQAAVAIRNARLFAQVQQYATELENRVISRTKALSLANQNLKEQIIKRERVEIELKEERNLLRTLINNLPDSIYVKNRANEIILANRKIERQSPNSVVPFDITTFTKDEQDLLDGVQSLISYQDSYTDDTGNQVWIEVTKVPLRDIHGVISGLIGVIHDISPLKRAESQLLTILDSARCLLWYALVEDKGGNLSWTFYVSNEEAAQTFLPMRLAPGRSYTQAWLDSRHPDDKERVELTDTNAIRQGRANYSKEYRCIDAKGTVRWLSEDVRVRQLTSGRWSLVGVCTDITARKRAEALLQQTNDELERRVEIRTAELVEANKVLKQEILDRKRAEADLRQRRHELEILRQASISFSTHRELQNLLQAVVEYAMRLIPSHNAHLFLNQGGKPVFGAAAWSEENRNQRLSFTNPRENGLTATVLRSGQRMVINEMSEHPLFQDTNCTGSIISLPLTAGEQVVGVLNLASGKSHYYHVEELRVLELLSDQAAISIQNVLHLTQIQQEIAERKRAEIAERDQRLLAEALRDAAASFSEMLDLPDVLEGLIKYLARVIPHHDSDSVILIEDERLARPTYYRRWVNDHWETIEPERLQPVDYQSIHNFRQMLQTRQPVVIADVAEDPNWVVTDYSKWIRSYVGAPILSKGKVIGFINLCAAHPHIFTPEHARRVQSFANQVGVAIQNTRLLAEIKQYAAELEERVNERTAQLDHERAQLNAILNAIRDGVIYSDTNRQIRYVNQALIEMTGLTLQQWLSGEAQRYINTTTDDMKIIWENVLDSLNRQGFWQGETKLKRADGSIFDAMLIRTEVTKTSGERTGVVTVVRDISQEKALEEQKRRFIAHAAHELRTPTANLKTRLYLMRRQPEKLKEHLSISEEVVKWMQVLIENLFDMSRFEHGVIVLDREDTILQEVVVSVVTFNEPEARNKAIRLEHHLPDQPIHIIGDANRLKQVVTNLITNAIHYTPANGTITVTVGWQKHANGRNYATISVRDTGIGIPPEYVPHLFQPFFRASDDSKGAGLGLSISHDIVVAHGGDLTVESTVGKGSLFTVWLPLP